MISGYNGESACPRKLLMAIETRLLLQGFLVSDHLSDRVAFIRQMNEWLKSGEIAFGTQSNMASSRRLPPS